MKTIIKITFVIALFSIFSFTGCVVEDNPEPVVEEATVFYSEWFSKSTWAGTSGAWYFEVPAPDLTEDIVENGVILAYASLDGDYNSVRPLPAFVFNANWSYLIPDYEYIMFTCDMIDAPTDKDMIRFIAIPGTVPALKSTSSKKYTEQELRNMTYHEVCQLYNIPE